MTCGHDAKIGRTVPVRGTVPEGYFSNERPEMLEFVPEGVGRILDVGCGEGGFSAMVRKVRGVEVWGVERDAGAARRAARRLDRVIRGDFDRVLRRLPKRGFGAVVFNDVLEHMSDPASALAQARGLLAPGGVVVASLPNVLHVSVLKSLLWDRDWRYAPYGILDRTHLRFFTRRSIRRLFEETGYERVRIKGINPNRNPLSLILAVLSLGWFAQSRFQQFACVAAVRRAARAVEQGNS